MMEIKIALLPIYGKGIGGPFFQGDNYIPDTDSAKIYLAGGENLNVPLSKVEKSGRMIFMLKTKIDDEIGLMAFFSDTEDKHMAFHSPG
jgi:predicted enzyme related to lactoylglutathione lyase